MKCIAHIRTAFPTKFGIPHQSGCIDSLPGKIIMEPEYRREEAFRGLDEFSHIWLLWEFSETVREQWSPTVRPPRLGGNTRKGVFSTRSPFRPNPIGLSCVKLRKIEIDARLGPVLYVEGVDLMDNTPIYDIKPYLPAFDSHPSAVAGFSERIKETGLKVVFPEELLERVPVPLREALLDVLTSDPRPRYQDDPERVYGMPFGEQDIRFRVQDRVLHVMEVNPYSSGNHIF
ncbi:MAG: tRNA (N6-threonylcarbamoyladenosine(37)-N6)-methyltransferase TrmO [Blautia sp.]|nr:tRNA (N6-threonylcarbamoyladenosine(37)-N6)-methyltransferase TrmO [Blautia sp.]